jgi:transcriptional regulator with XRE-family HTH domain
MNATNKLLDKYMETCSIRTASELALKLRVSKQAVSGWRNEKAHPEADSIAIMCDGIQEPLRQWLPLIEAERARSPAVRKVWLRLAQTTASIALTFGLLNVQTVHAQELGSFSRNPGTLYIM